MLNVSSLLRDRFLGATLALLACTGASAAELNTLKALTVKPTKAGTEVVVSGERSPAFTVFRLNAPDRLVVDVSSADASGIKGHHEGNGPVSAVVAAQYSDDKASVARLLLALDGAGDYDVVARGNDVVIKVDTRTGNASKVAKAAPAPKVNPPAPAAPVKPTAVAVSPRVVAPKAAPAKAAPAKKTASKRGLGENVVAAEADTREVKRPATAITSLRMGASGLSVKTDGEVAHWELLELENPPRLAIDIMGVKLKARAPDVNRHGMKDLRVASHGDKVRLVLDADGAMPSYFVSRRKDGLDILLGATAERAAKQEAPAAPKTPAEAVEAAAKPTLAVNTSEAATPSTPPVILEDVIFTEAEKGGRIDLKLSGKATYKVERPDPRSAVLTIENAKLPKKLARSMDTSALDTPVKMVSTFAVPGATPRVRVVVAADGNIEESAAAVSKGIAWNLEVDGVKTEAVAVQPRAAGFASEAAAYAEEGTPRQSRYTGRKVNFEFQDIEIRNVLRVIAEVSKRNIIVADNVSGSITIRLRNVPWDQALELILRSKGLGKETFGNIIRVAPLTTLEEEAKLRQERKAAMEQQEELVVQLIPVNYATAGDMAPRVKEMLSERGSVTTDERTNVLIVRDIRAGVARARGLVRNLDLPTPQVLIESRIVEASTTFTRSLGVQWGGSTQFAPGTGNATGLLFPNTIVVRGGSDSGANAGTASNPNFAVNLPAPVGQGEGGALGFTFGSAGGSLALNLRLSAAEGEGMVKTISAPKVTTMDNSTARISQGVSIPFSQVSASGVNTTFVEARLSLEVTPHITQDGAILMNINAQNNQPDPSNTGANGQPSIMRKEATTQVLVRDGHTTVIGGIYVRRGATQSSGVPFFSKIPVLGWFFKNSTESDERQELLIFITPRIINRTQISETIN